MSLSGPFPHDHEHEGLENEQEEDEENLLGVSYFSLPDMKKRLEHARGSTSNLEWMNK